MDSTRVIVVVQPAVNLLDLAGPVQVLDAANFQGASYRLEFVGATESATSAQGLRLGSGAQLSPFLSQRSHVDDAVHAVQDHIAENLAGKHALADLAARVHLSPHGLSRAFTAATGVMPLELQQRLRLALAEDLLSGTDLPVAAVATRTGFRDAEYPTTHLGITGPGWPWRPTLLALAALLVGGTAGWPTFRLATRKSDHRSPTALPDRGLRSEPAVP